MGLYLGKEKVSNVASVITQNVDSMATEIQNHIADTNIHITADERTKWNTITEMQNHITNTDIHITADERTKWNAAADNTEDFASTGVMNTNINMNNNSIKNLAAPTQNTDAANKHYVDSKALPTTSTSDNGKVLSVVNGTWVAAAMSSGAYVGSYAGDGRSSKTLTFNFKPGVIFMFTTGYSYIYIGIRGCNKIDRIDGSGSMGLNMDQGNITWNNTSIVLTDSDYCSISNSKCTYYYAVIPAMN